MISISEGVRQTAVTRVGVCGQLRGGRGGRGGVALPCHRPLRYHRNTPAALFPPTFLTVRAPGKLGHHRGVPLDNFSALRVAFLHFIMVIVVVIGGAPHAIVTFRGCLEVGDE